MCGAIREAVVGETLSRDHAAGKAKVRVLWGLSNVTDDGWGILEGQRTRGSTLRSKAVTISIAEGRMDGEERVGPATGVDVKMVIVLVPSWHVCAPCS